MERETFSTNDDQSTEYSNARRHPDLPPYHSQGSIQEASGNTHPVEDGGSKIHSWDFLEMRERQQLYQEKRRMRTYLTIVITGSWLLWTIVGLVDFLATQNPFLIETSLPVGGINALLVVFLNFYFK